MKLLAYHLLGVGYFEIDYRVRKFISELDITVSPSVRRELDIAVSLSV